MPVRRKNKNRKPRKKNYALTRMKKVAKKEALKVISKEQESRYSTQRIGPVVGPYMEIVGALLTRRGCWNATTLQDETEDCFGPQSLPEQTQAGTVKVLTGDNYRSGNEIFFNGVLLKGCFIMPDALSDAIVEVFLLRSPAQSLPSVHYTIDQIMPNPVNSDLRKENKLSQEFKILHKKKYTFRAKSIGEHRQIPVNLYLPVNAAVEYTPQIVNPLICSRSDLMKYQYNIYIRSDTAHWSGAAPTSADTYCQFAGRVLWYYKDG